MTRALLVVLLAVGGVAGNSQAQEAAPNSVAAPATAAPKAKKEAAPDPVKGLLGSSTTADGQPITTEIFANEAYFDSKESVGTFSGAVIVKDPRFSLQADKLTVYLGKGETRGLDRAVAEGNVAVVRDAAVVPEGAPAPAEGASNQRSVGRGERAVYTAKDGNVELSGSPRVLSGLNTHVATSPDTVMIINQAGQLTTRGPSRTEIRQEPKAEASPKP